MKQKTVLFLCLFLVSCDEHFNVREVYGYYTPVNYKNNFDTIQLKQDFSYHRKVYNKDNRLFLEMDGKWTFTENHRIGLEPFYLNLDDDLAKFPSNTSDTSKSMDTYFETTRGSIQFCVGYYVGENCYRKTK